MVGTILGNPHIKMLSLSQEVLLEMKKAREIGELERRRLVS